MAQCIAPVLGCTMAACVSEDVGDCVVTVEHNEQSVGCYSSVIIWADKILSDTRLQNFPTSFCATMHNSFIACRVCLWR